MKFHLYLDTAVLLLCIRVAVKTCDRIRHLLKLVPGLLLFCVKDPQTTRVSSCYNPVLLLCRKSYQGHTQYSVICNFLVGNNIYSKHLDTITQTHINLIIIFLFYQFPWILEKDPFDWLLYLSKISSYHGAMGHVNASFSLRTAGRVHFPFLWTLHFCKQQYIKEQSLSDQFPAALPLLIVVMNLDSWMSKE